jgi:hypothetical protein
VPPLDFNVLVHDLIPQGSELRETVQNLLSRKMSGDELNLESRLDVINMYLEERIAHYEAVASAFEQSVGVTDEVLDHLFRSALIEVWGETGQWSW